MFLCKTVKNLRPNIFLTFFISYRYYRTRNSKLLSSWKLMTLLYLDLSSISILQKKLDKFTIKENNPVYLPDTYQDHHIVLNFSSLIASIDDINIAFSPLEFKLLKLFTQNPHIILTREYILYFLWDRNKNHVEESSLNSMICRIRKKIKPSKS